MTGANQISEVTRRAIVDYLELSGISWAGRLTDPEFLARLYDLRRMPSTDRRYSDAAGDIFQHTVNNMDWTGAWVFYDSRFDLMHGADDMFLKFLCETVNPIVRSSTEEALTLVDAYNAHLTADGWSLVKQREVSGRPIFVAAQAGRKVVFAAPIGWTKVDCQSQEVRVRLEQATSEEQWQAVGLLCREVLITAAQQVYDPARHPPIDDKTPSATDAGRMLEAIFAAELKGSKNDEARAHAKAAVKLALALQHKRTADFRMAALCAEGATSVVNMLAILAGRRGGHERLGPDVRQAQRETAQAALTELWNDVMRGGVPVIVTAPRLILQLAPFAASAGERLDPKKVAAEQLTFPPNPDVRVKTDTDGRQWWSSGVPHHRDGLPNPETNWVLRLVRPGYLEYRSTVGRRIDDDPDILVDGRRLEGTIVRTLEKMGRIAANLGLGGEGLISIALDGIEDVELMRPRGGGRRFKRQQLGLTIAELKDIAAPMAMALQEQFDILWQSGGFADGSPSYDDDGWAGYADPQSYEELDL